MKDKIREKINNKEWKFHELLKIKEVSTTVSEELYHELSVKEQLELIWDCKVGENLTFGSLFKQTVAEQLEVEVMSAFQEKFESATVNFEGNEINNTPSLPVEKPASLTEKYKAKENTSFEDLVKGKDVIDDTPTLEEKDGKVSTRAGNVKVERV